MEVPKDGSVPAINEWQLIRRCEPAPPESHKPSADDPQLTELGVPVPGSQGEQAAHAADPNEYFEIEKILRATKMGGKYKLLVKWKGHSRQVKGIPQKQLSKEFVRRWLIENDFQGLEGQKVPFMDDAYIQSISDRYIELYENITGEKFVPADLNSIESRIQKNLGKFLKD